MTRPKALPLAYKSPPTSGVSPLTDAAPRLQRRFQRLIEPLGPGPWSLDAVRAAWDEIGSQREGDGWDERLKA